MARLKTLERSPTIRERVQDAIRAYVSENGLKAGDALPPETKLAEQLGVSRLSVREAVKVLESTGFVRSERGNGLFVGSFSFDPLLEHLPYGLMDDLGNLSDLLQMRAFLELGMADAVLARLTEEQLGAARAVLEQMKAQAAAGGVSPEADREFHRLYCQNLNNPLISKVTDVFWQAFRRASQHAAIGDTDPARTYRDHERVVRALETGDLTGLRNALEQHYAYILERLGRAQQREKGGA